REEAETRNMAEQALWQTERFLAESGDKLPEDSRSKVNDALSELRAALGGSDINAIKNAHESLTRTMQEASTALYAQAGASAGQGGPQGAGDATFGGTGGGATGQQGSEDVVDAEIVDEDDKDKK